ncbi:MAG: hypothetical protein K6U08_07585 [Firmicutes bacterium]|nr:hypothetical protein [Bacillota bacterium]
MDAVGQQVLSLAMMFLTAAGLLFLHDLVAVAVGWLRPPRRGRRGRLGRATPSGVWDLFVSLVAALVVYVAAFLASRGRFGLEAFTGLVLGAGAYVLLARGVVVRLTVRARAATCGLLRRATAAVSRPLGAVGRAVRSAGEAAGKAGAGVAGWVRSRAVEAGRGIRGFWAGFRSHPKE